MPTRAIATTSVSFGLVSVPVKLYSTGEPGSRVSFNLLHADCGTRLKQQYICPKHEVIVARDEMSKGFEFSKDQYVTFSEIALITWDPTKAGRAPIVCCRLRSRRRSGWPSPNTRRGGSSTW
jgi:DNA end-binding protein Ku